MKIRYLLPALLLGALSPLAPTPAASAFVDVSITVAPPVLPVYEQPPCPTDGYLWTPGYWGYADAGYYWVPGVWVAPPRIGFLWTPGYWGFGDGYYAFHSGYWGPTVGFYGGVNYGYGYGGYGYGGGRWEGNRFAYNTSITNINKTVIHNTYIDRSAARATTTSRTSFNGPGGITARPDSRQLAAAHGTRIPATSDQVSHRETAAQERRNFTPAAGGNHPAEAHNARPSEPARDGADRFLSPQDQDRANRRAQNVANERPITQEARRARSNGLSPQEQDLVNRRQQSVNAGRSREDALRARGYENASSGRVAREGNPYGGRPVANDRRAYADPRAASGKPQKEDRRAEKGDKHDKHQGQGY